MYLCMITVALLSEMHYNSTESLETIRQNIHTTNTLLSSLTPITLSDPLKAFTFHGIKYQLGQWIDVKDTINQWLEAQVIGLRANQVCVHYNGWGSQWDEWLDNGSPRIALFRSHTLQYSTSRYLCPSPNIPPDAETTEIPLYRSNLKQLLVQHMGILDKLRKMMGQFLLLEEKGKKEQLAAQLAPLVDRAGRMLTEFGPHLMHMALPQAIKDDGAENPEESNGVEGSLQVPLIANSGDVALVTNLLDRVLFGNTPTLELHVHSDLAESSAPNSLIPNELSDSLNELPIPASIPLPEVESVGIQADTKVECQIQTETPQMRDAEAATERGESVGVQVSAGTEEEKRVAETSLVVSNGKLVPKSKLSGTMKQYGRNGSAIYSKKIVKTGITIPVAVLKKRKRIK
eukprot:TRINITY_DN1347_c0_g2_i8.p1 TRINITY_DN1347_c0_g2~~TRINITY_DN1347_c0_g2_i8.p1  ORF type:complete len:435 (-),score=107.97 TRINITY_DN1347_c0_g2_i8:118-1326(-)